MSNYVLCNLITNLDYSTLEKNQVTVGTHTFNQLFGNNDSTGKHYTMIANLLYETVCHEGCSEGSVWMSPLQLQDVCSGVFDENGTRKVLVKSAVPLDNKVVEAGRVLLQLEKYEQGSLPPMGCHTLHLDKLDQIFQRCVCGLYLTVNQRIAVFSDKGVPLSARVKVLSYKNPSSPSGRARTIEELRFSKITPQTLIDYETEETSKLKIIKPVKAKGCPRIHLSVSLVPALDGSKGSVSYLSGVCGGEMVNQTVIKERESRAKNSLVVPIETLRSHVIERLRRQVVYPKYPLRISHDNDWDALVTISRIVFDSTAGDKKSVKRLKRYKEGLEIQGTENFIFTPESDRVIFSEGTPQPATQMSFKVVDVIDEPESRDLSQPERDWINVSEFIAKVKAMKLSVVEGQRFNLCLSTGEFLIELLKVGGACSSSLAATSSTVPVQEKVVWRLTKETKVGLRTAFSQAMDLIENERPLPLQRIGLQVSREVQVSDFIEVYKEDLIHAIRETLHQKPILPGQSLLVSCKGERFRFKIDNFDTIKTLEKFEAKSNYQQRGLITIDTKIDLEIKQGQKIHMPSRSLGLMRANPVKALKEMKLGGMEAHNLRLVRQALLPRGRLRNEAKKRGIKPIKGLLFYGPPGTGKTTFAKKIGAVFGCTEKNGRLKLITASELFDRYIGSTEKNIRELFVEAETELKENGPEKAKLYILVIDEIDAIAAKRTDQTHEARVSSQAQLLGKVDGLQELPNVMVVGITNRKDSLDPAVIRKGRFGTHLEFKLPDAKARKEIFDIYLKRNEEIGCLANDIDLGLLVSKTGGMSGAQIEDIVNSAGMFVLERLNKVADSDLSTSKDGVLRMGDLLKAFEECKQEGVLPMSQAAMSMFG